MREFLEHLRIHALHTRGPFTLRSGAVSDWYLDARQTTFDGAGAILVARAVLSCLDPTATAVGGMTMGADPIAVATAVVSTGDGRPLKAFSIRKASKRYGLGDRIVGPVSGEDRVVIIEDTTTTGGALIEAIDVVSDAGFSIVQAIALMDRSGGRVAERLAERNIPYVALATPADLGVGP